MDDNREVEDLKPARRVPWNKGKLIGAKPPLRPSHVWSIRTKLQMADRKRDQTPPGVLSFVQEWRTRQVSYPDNQ